MNKTQVPTVGWLHYELDGSAVRAKLLSKGGLDLLPWLEHARLVACRGTRGALIEGVQYRKKGSKHSIADRQAWWCEAPPRTKPLLDHQARVLAAEKLYEKEMRAWDGENAD